MGGGGGKKKNVGCVGKGFSLVGKERRRAFEKKKEKKPTLKKTKTLLVGCKAGELRFERKKKGGG